MAAPGFVTVPRSFISITVCVDADWALASMDVREAHLLFPIDQDESGEEEEYLEHQFEIIRPFYSARASFEN